MAGTPDKKLRLLLVNPRQELRHYALQDELARLLGKQRLMPTYALPIVAALTPDHWEVRIVDEDLGEAIPDGEKPDLVGITSINATCRRAFEIADRFRADGVPVILGGVFASSRPDAALEHADAVVIGPAEPVWAQCLGDLEAGRLQRRYAGAERFDARTSPRPRWDLVDLRKVMSVEVRASTGCPYDCEFCLVPQLFGRKMSFRDVDEVVAEIASLPLKMLNFVDDNLTIRKPYARELMAKMKGLGAQWVCQSSLDVADDPELLAAMAEAGCIYVVIGFESLNPASLRETGKKQNAIERYREAIKKIHAAGIQIIASFVVGFDSDTAEDFDRIVQFTHDNDLAFVMLHLLTVVEGTRLHARMEREGRLCAIDPALLTGSFPSMHYYNFSQIEIFNKYYETLERIYSVEAARKKARSLFGTGAFQVERPGPVGAWAKLASSMTVLRRFVFTGDREKRRLFRELFALARQKKVAMSSVVLFLLTMEGFRDHLAAARLRHDEMRARIAATDRGPWRLVEGAAPPPPRPLDRACSEGAKSA